MGAGEPLATAVNVSVAFVATTSNFPAGMLAASGVAVEPTVNWNPDGYPLLASVGQNLRTSGLTAGVYGVRVCGIACRMPGATRVCTSACASTVLTVLQPPLEVRVNGFSASSPMTVSTADLSLTPTVTDRSLTPSTANAYQDAWQCSPLCLVDTSTGTAVLANVTAGSTYTIAFTRTIALDSRTATFNNTVTVVQSAVVRLDAQRSSYSNGHFDTSDRVTLTATVTGAYAALTWACDGCSASLQAALFNLAAGVPQSSFSTVGSDDGTQTVLVVAGGVADPGSSLTFTATVTSATVAGTASSSSTVTYRQQPVCSLSVVQQGGAWVVYTDSCIGVDSFLFGIVPAGDDVGSGVTFGVTSAVASVSLQELPPGEWTVFVVLSGPDGGSVATADVTVPTFDQSSVNLPQYVAACNAGVSGGNAFDAQLACFLAGQYLNQAFAAQGSRRLSTASESVLSSSRSLASTADLVSLRDVLVYQLPSLGALVDNSSAGTTTRLGEVLNVVQYPSQMSYGSTVFAAQYTAAVLATAAALTVALGAVR